MLSRSIFLSTFSIFMTACGSQVAFESQSDAIVYGENERELVFSQEAGELNKIGRVLRADNYSCTGSLVGPDLVLTNAHCVSKDGKRYDGKIIFRVLETLGGLMNQGTAEVTEMWIGKSDIYEQENSIEYLQDDWAILRIDRRLGDKQGFYKLDSIESINDRNASGLTLAGYGYFFHGGRQLTVDRECKIRDVWNRGLLGHDCDSSLGDSGAPLLKCDNESCKIVALHTVERPTAEGVENNTAFRYTPELSNVAISVKTLERRIQNLIR